MQYVYRLGLGLCLAGMITWAGCGGGADNSPEGLVAQFKAVADAALEDIHKQADMPKAIEITRQLAATGPGGIDKLLDVLADPATDPRTMMLVTICVKNVLTPENFPRLLALSGPENNVNTRVNAAHLVSSFQDEALTKRAKELLQDPEPRVRLAIFQTELLRGTPEALGMVDALWADPATPLNDRVQIVLGLPEQHVAAHLPIFREALPNDKLAPPARARAILVLGRHGSAEDLVLLETAAAKDPSPDNRQQAQVAWEAAKSRLDAAMAAGAAPAADTAAPAVPANALTPADIANFTGGKTVEITVPGPTGPIPAESAPATSQ